MYYVYVGMSIVSVSSTEEDACAMGRLYAGINPDEFVVVVAEDGEAVEAHYPQPDYGINPWDERLYSQDQSI